jgi:hypothetical protein
MSNGQDDDSTGFNLVHDTEWIAPQQVAPRSVLVPSPRFWLFQDCQLRGLEFCVETECRSRASLGIPSSTRFGLFESLGEILKSEGHPEQPFESGDGPRPRERFARGPR